MSRYRLRSDSLIIPGAFQFYQDGPKPYKFHPSPVARDQATAVLNFRTANNLPRASFDEALADVIDYNAYRLGADANFFIRNQGSNDGPTFTQPPNDGGCKGCGAKLE